MKVIITGGAGFIGCNAAVRYLQRGAQVVVFDNLSRQGTSENLAWLQSLGGQLLFVNGDIRDFAALQALFRAHNDADAVLHLAAQVAVTTSVLDPRTDFEINCLGTFNLLEAIRLQGINPVILYTSTNKVYGGMEDAAIVEKDGRYVYRDLPYGASEERQLDFHSPYGCSKGAADQYMVDYARIYGLRTVVFRQSCIYGYHQMGVEDQGWVAWFIIAAVTGRPITIYGDGKQARDMLFIDDVLNLYDHAMEHVEEIKGRAYNVGGGPDNQMAIVEMIHYLEQLREEEIPLQYGDWRPGDQRVFVADIRKAERELGWKPQVSPQEGVRKLLEWVEANRPLFERMKHE